MTQKLTQAQRVNKKRRKSKGKQYCITLVEGIRSGKINPKTLSTEDRRECIPYLMYQGMRVIDLSRLFRVERNTIMNDIKRNREELATGVIGGTLAEVAGQLLEMGQELSSRALATKKFLPKDAKSVADMMLAINTQLQDLGVLPKRPIQIETYAHKPYGEMTDAELDGYIAEGDRIERERAERLLTQGDERIIKGGARTTSADGEVRTAEQVGQSPESVPVVDSEQSEDRPQTSGLLKPESTDTTVQ